MKKLILIVTFISLLAPAAYAGLVAKSEYDLVWTITVVDCRGGMIVYRNCRIVNAGQFWISFMPDQGRIASGNGREVHINTADTCTQVIKRQED